MDVISYLSDARETEPVGAVVLHRLRGEYLGLYHEISDDPETGAPLLGPGNVLTYEAGREFFQQLTGASSRRQLLPERLLVADADLVAWWQPAQRRPIIFQTKDKGFDDEMSGRPVLHPALLFLGRPQGLAVYALASNVRPGEDTALFRAPYYNLYATGTMCDGDVPIPPAPLPTAEVLAGYETAFYDSAFAHTNLGSDAMIRWPGGHDGFWRAMLGGSHTLFPSHALVALRVGGEALTLGKVINTDARDLVLDV